MIYCANKNHPIRPVYFILTISFWVIMMTGCAQSPVSQTSSESVPEPPVVKASAPPQEPILRLETGMHTAGIWRIGMDAAERYLATCSTDKTVRVWDVATGHLIRTLRPPIDQKEDGQLYAVAVSPDARIIATGGWTGWNWGDSHSSIYLFDLETGKLIRLITGIPCSIFHLSFSLDGQFMAVCLEHGKGVQVYETTTWSLSAWDKQYGDQSNWADFDINGQMVTASSDGYIRLYDSSFQRIAKATAPGGIRPHSARFSPDGEKIAVGHNTNKVDILSAKDLTLFIQPDVTGVSNELFSVCWSADGQFLYAAGKWADSQGFTSIRKWSLAGKGFTDQTASRNSIQDIRSLKNGGIIYGAADPAYGVFDSHGNRSIFVSSLTANFMDSRDFFHISPDGTAVRFCFEQKGKRPAQFSIPDRTLTLYSEYPPENPKMISPRISDFSLSITDWKNNVSPKLNGNPLTRLSSFFIG